MNEKEFLVEIMKSLQRKYNCANEILKTTQDMCEALSRDDRVSSQLLISMRQEEINKASESDRDIRELLECLSVEKRVCVRQWLSQGSCSEAEDAEAKIIAATSRKIKGVLEKIIVADKVMSRRLAGEKSYYK